MYSILFSVYAVILIVWFTIYDEISFNLRQGNGDSSKRCSCVKTFLKLRIVLVYVL